jgi:hypothetical protein
MTHVPYKKLTDSQKEVSFHADVSVQHSGIIPSGEGNYYDPGHKVTNVNNWDGSITDPFPVLAAYPSNLDANPEGNPPSPIVPDGFEYSNITVSGTIDNPEAYKDGEYLPLDNNGISNNVMWPQPELIQGGYIHYVPEQNTGLLSDGPTIYIPTTGITPTTQSFNPYPMNGGLSSRHGT